MSAPFNAEQLAEALRLAETASSAREAASLLRQRFAALRVVVVDAFDMRGEVPAAQGAQRRLYLGASDGHCWSVTADPAQAAGLFLA
ncbi:hypothetical protein [Roseateles saccharophilus]|uniref:Uncharacterized protein n=1 Tax=Roseateles saccharophilus TaxID=304 RepID=A0A4R3VHA1_ROSSA|nr:hypothetical protein [Roseateles saccharophilus]MDG0832035.1 hypothetical protein [Roseateles saccharophilus]TCV03443.1 hypothetical protein EV671_100398 [Roseateles saccharophilus]